MLIEGSLFEKYLKRQSSAPDLLMIKPRRKKIARITNGLVAAALLFALRTALADELAEQMAFWESKAMLCEASPGGVRFPSKQTNEPPQPCNDGDMTLFNGLLCAAGDQRGCIGVAEAQDPSTGEWFRSPRIRIQGNDRGGASFSPDMALGVQLYLIKVNDATKAYKWLMWMHNHVACSFEVFGMCVLQALPRFCTDDAPDAGCTMRHGDAAVLASTVNYLQREFGMPDLPDGRLRGHLGSFSGYGPVIAQIDANVNRVGYSQHLVAVEIMVMRAIGVSDSKLQTAAKRLAEREPNNAFFMYLNEGNTQRVRQQLLDRCPKADTALKLPLHQWQWEREDADRAWESSCFWDCIFLGKLLMQQ